METSKNEKCTIVAENGEHNPGKPLSRKTGKHYSQSIFRDWCKKCGICSSFCPKNVIGRDEGGWPVFERPEDCIGCRFCELHCPDFAITVHEIDPDPKRDI